MQRKVQKNDCLLSLTRYGGPVVSIQLLNKSIERKPGIQDFCFAVSTGRGRGRAGVGRLFLASSRSLRTIMKGREGRLNLHNHRYNTLPEADQSRGDLLFRAGPICTSLCNVFFPLVSGSFIGPV